MRAKQKFKKGTFSRRVFSILMALAMVITLMPMNATEVKADEVITAQSFTLTHNSDGTYTVTDVTVPDSYKLYAGVVKASVVERIGDPLVVYEALLSEFNALINAREPVFSQGLNQNFEVVEISPDAHFNFTGDGVPDAGILISVAKEYDENYDIYPALTLGMTSNPAVGESTQNQLGTTTKTKITSMELNVDWSKIPTLTVGQTAPNITECPVTASGTGVSGIGGVGWAIKALPSHVTSGYISQDAYDRYAIYDHWMELDKYKNYTINATDTYACYIVSLASDGYCFADAKGVDLTSVVTSNVTVAQVISDGTKGEGATAFLMLGTVSDIEAAKGGATTISSMTLNVDWSKIPTLTVGQTAPNITECPVTASGTGVSGIGGVGWAIKALPSHVTSGYISQDAYDRYAIYDHWMELDKYKNYTINATDTYACYIVSYASDGYCFADAAGVDITSVVTSNVTVAQTISGGFAGEAAVAFLILGKVSDIEAAQGGATSTKHNITISPDIQHGTIAADKNKAANGELVTVTVTPDAGYKLSSLIFKVDGGQEDVKGRVINNKFVFTMYDKDVTLTATFESTSTPATNDIITDLNFTVDYSKFDAITTDTTYGELLDMITENFTGSYSPELESAELWPGEIYINDDYAGHNESSQVDLDAPVEFESHVNIYCGIGSTSEKKIFNFPNSYPTIKLNGSAVTDYSKHDGADLVGDRLWYAAYDSEKTVALMYTTNNSDSPNKWADFLIDLGTISDIQAAVNAANPNPTEYTITATAGANGSISPSGAVSVSKGGSKTFTITPDTGYEIDTLTVDGAVVTASSSYTFSNVTAAHTIAVTFKQVSSTPDPGEHTHTIVTDAAVASTCTEAGKTEGKHCSVCGEIITAQATVPALGHDWSGDWVITKPATTITEGKKECTCKREGCNQKKYEMIPVIGTPADPNEGKLDKDAEVAPEAPIEEATLDNTKTELLSAPAIFTAEEKQAIDNGADARVWMEVSKTDESSIPSADKTKISDAATSIMGENPTITYFDADLFKQVGDGAATQLHEPGIEVEVTIKVPETLLNGDNNFEREYKIIRLHTDVATGASLVDILSGTFDKITGEFSFKTDKFSTYAIAYTDKKLVTGVTLTPETATLTQAGQSVQLTATVAPADAANKKVTWTTSDSRVAAVDENGKVTAVGNGTCTITATTEDGAKTAECKITVNIPSQPSIPSWPSTPSQPNTPVQPDTPGQPDTPDQPDTPGQPDTPVQPDTPDQPDTPVQPDTPGTTVTVTKEQKEKNALALNAKLKVSQTKSQLDIVWGEVSGADGYNVYAAYCGTKFTKKSLNQVKSGKITKLIVKKINGKKLNLKKNYKLYVEAYKLVDGKQVILGRTITAHIVGRQNTGYTNVKDIKLKKTSLPLKKGKTATIQAEAVLVDKSKKQLADAHAKEFRYATSNKKVATVSSEGKIKAVGKGTCTIYVYARDGYAKKVTVTVK